MKKVDFSCQKSIFLKVSKLVGHDHLRVRTDLGDLFRREKSFGIPRILFKKGPNTQVIMSYKFGDFEKSRFLA